MSDPSNTSPSGAQDGQDAENAANPQAGQTVLIPQNMAHLPILAPSAPSDSILYGLPGETRNMIYDALAFRYSADRSELPSRHEQADRDWLIAHGWTCKTVNMSYNYHLWTRYLEFPSDNWYHGVLALGSRSFGTEFLTYVADNLRNNPNYWDVEVRAHAFDNSGPLTPGDMKTRVTSTYTNVPPTFKNSPTWVRLNCELTCDGAIAPNAHIKRVAQSFAMSIIDAALLLKREYNDGTNFRHPGHVQRAIEAFMIARRAGEPTPTLDLVVRIKINTGKPSLGLAPNYPTVINLNQGNNNPWNIGVDAFIRIVKMMHGNLGLWKCWMGVFVDGHEITIDDQRNWIFPPALQPKPIYYNGYGLSIEVLMPDVEGLTQRPDSPSDSDDSHDFEPEESSSESEDAMQE